MIALPETVALPLKLDETGAIHVSNMRVTLDTLINFLHLGETPEDLHEGFPTIPQADIYAVIAYYLAHQTEIDEYLKTRNEIAKHSRQEWEARNPPLTKAQLVTRRDAKRYGE